MKPPELSSTGKDFRIDAAAGPLNRIGQELGVRPPFRQTVRVCSACNNGWMSRLEAVARRGLTPFIRGEPGEIAAEDTGPIGSRRWCDGRWRWPFEGAGEGGGAARSGTLLPQASRWPSLAYWLVTRIPARAPKAERG
jgi:hypothetical protein